MEKVEILLPDELLRQVDATAHSQDRSRDELLREAVERYLHHQGTLHRWEDPTILDAVATQDHLARLIQDSDWDVVREIRQMRECRR